MLKNIGCHNDIHIRNIDKLTADELRLRSIFQPALLDCLRADIHSDKLGMWK